VLAFLFLKTASFIATLISMQKNIVIPPIAHFNKKSLVGVQKRGYKVCNEFIRLRFVQFTIGVARRF